MTLAQLKKLLDHGDYVKIARKVGYKDLVKGRKYVYKVLAGKNNKASRGICKKIVEAAEQIALYNSQSIL